MGMIFEVQCFAVNFFVQMAEEQQNKKFVAFNFVFVTMYAHPLSTKLKSISVFNWRVANKINKNKLLPTNFRIIKYNIMINLTINLNIIILCFKV